jgi:hypothetical protein
MDRFEAEVTLTAFTWIGNVLYWPQTKINLVFDGDRTNPLAIPGALPAEIRGIAVGRKADALFFLHTARGD